MFSTEDAELVGYFAITIKPITVNAKPFSNTVKRKLSRVSTLNEQDQTYNLAVYLIAQLGKNYNNGANEEKLLSFYCENGFRQFDIRLAESSNSEPHELIQLLKLI